MDYQVFTLNERMDLIDQVASLDNQSWPTFLQNSDVTSWSHFYSDLSDYVLVLTQSDDVIAVGFTVPVYWNQKAEGLPNSIQSVIQQGINMKEAGETANTLIPVGALVDAKVQGKGLSSIVLKEMKKLANKLNIESLVVPVRPTKKSLYPLQSIHSYAHWRREDGLLSDPWLRVHERLGAEIIHIAECTLKVESELSNWSTWTNMELPESGKYIIPGALSCIEVDINSNLGVYREPNVWMKHPM
jgi:hypothetical protein